MATPVNNCGIVILAGGQSSRLGSPKQLLPFRDGTLLRHAAQIALEAGCGPVMVVTGSNAEAMNRELAGLDIEIVHNPDWAEGMASTLRTGLRALQEKYPGVDGVVFMVCDQPFVTRSVLLCLTDRQKETGKGITASSYGGKAGTPALFHRAYFEKLLTLKGDKGARTLMAEYPHDVALVPFAEGAIDIDTKEDHEKLIKMTGTL
ncbi:MAG TPA: nucleotidyltransferase family protein [Phnomibacter sp.]|nr:nucleotidyltransferase family protein [Phnomibacter sp.]